MKMRYPRNYWTFEKVQLEAAFFETVGEWKRVSQYSYNIAIKNGWLEQINSHMKRERNMNNYWTLERCKESALQFDTKKAWVANFSGAFNAAYRNNWLSDCCSHMS